MALITLMVFNAPIMAISLSQPNSSLSINETPGLLHSISTQRHSTFGGPRIISLNTLLSAQHNQETLRLLFQTKCSHLTLGFLHGHSAKQSLPTATAAPQPPGHGQTGCRWPQHTTRNSIVEITHYNLAPTVGPR